MVIIIQVVAFLSGTMSIEQVKEKFGNLYSTGGKKKKKKKVDLGRGREKKQWQMLMQNEVEAKRWEMKVWRQFQVCPDSTNSLSVI